MKYFSFLALVLVFASCINSKTGSGNIITETRNAGSFTSVSASSAVHVGVSMGAKESVVVEADDNIMPYVETSVSNGTLKVRLKGISNLKNATVNVHVTLTELDGLNASSASEIRSKGILTGSGKVTIESSSAAKIDAELNAPSVVITASSAAEVTLKGRTKSVDAEASSAATIKAGELQAENAKAETSSAGSIHVFASVSIDGAASSSGSVRYTGGAVSSKISESSGGSVKPE